MTATRTLQMSFSGGHLSGEMHGHIDDARYQSGASLLRNFIPLPSGPARRRPGTRYVSTCRTVTVDVFQFITGDPGQVEVIAHGMAVGDEVSFETDGELPGPLIATRSYFVSQVFGVDTFGLSSVKNGPNLLTYGTVSGAHTMTIKRLVRPLPFVYSPTQAVLIEMGEDYFRFHVDGALLRYDSPPAYVVGLNGTWIFTTLTFGAVHSFHLGDPIRLEGVASAPLRTDTTYYATNIGATTIALAETYEKAIGGLAGDRIQVLTGAFAIKAHYAYLAGDIVYWAGLPTGNYACRISYPNNNAPQPSAYWHELPNDGLPGGGIYEIAAPYASEDLFKVNFDQSGDVMTLTCQGYPPYELRRNSATSWSLEEVVFGSLLPPPDFVATGIIARRTGIVTVSNANPGVFTAVSSPEVGVGDTIYLRGITWNGTVDPDPSDGLWVVNERTGGALLLTGLQFTLKNYQTGIPLNGTGGISTGGTFEFVDSFLEVLNHYVVTSVDKNGVESQPSDAASIDNNLTADGAENGLLWTRIPGAIRYRLYKRKNGIFGYIGELNADDPTVTPPGPGPFRDRNIAPSLDIQPPRLDPAWPGEQPGAVGHFDGRRIFAGTVNSPQGVWMTRVGTESDMSYSLPLNDDDRIFFELASRQEATVRHVVPMDDLILLTSSGEYRISPVNSDAITPESISARQQSSIGASHVRPHVVNNVIVFTAARGGHVRGMGFRAASQSYQSDDLSLRSTDLFDDYELVDSAYSKAPLPVIWYVVHDGSLRSLSIVPEESVAGWAKHDTAGEFEGVAALPEGSQDALYVVVRRPVGDAHHRFIERLDIAPIASDEDNLYVDCSLDYDGTNYTAIYVFLTGGAPWTIGSPVTIGSSAAIFAFPGTTDVGDQIAITAQDGTVHPVTITSVTSATEAEAVATTDISIYLQSGAKIEWAWKRATLGGLDHLEGSMVTGVADGVPYTPQEVVGGRITLPTLATKVNAGLAYVSDLRTLPVAIPMEGGGQGRTKNVREASVDVLSSGTYLVGPDENHLVPAKLGAGLHTGEKPVTVVRSWNPTGQVFLRQEDPLPCNIVRMTLHVSLGS